MSESNLHRKNQQFQFLSLNKKQAVPRRPFTVEDDAKLIEMMNNSHFVNWDIIAQKMGNRSSRQCRERWVNYLSPGIRTDPWTEAEDQLLISKMNELGRCWSTIGRFFNGRSENDIKNRWYSHLRYRSIEHCGKIQIVTDPSLSPFPERKKRKRAKVSPQQNALYLLEQQKQKKEMEEIQNDPFLQDQASNNSKPLIFDFWDTKLFEDNADIKFEQEYLPIPQLTFPFPI